MLYTFFFLLETYQEVFTFELSTCSQFMEKNIHSYVLIMWSAENRSLPFFVTLEGTQHIQSLAS